MDRQRFLRFLIFLVLFLFCLYCYVKDYGYANEHSCQYSTVPLEEEYLYQHFECRYNQDKQPRPGRATQPPASERRQWQEAYEHHHFNSVRTYKDAYNRVIERGDKPVEMLG